MYKLNDVVVSLVDNPEGVFTYHFKGKVGVVAAIEMINGERCYRVDFQYIPNFLFSESELRYATDEEIKEAFIRTIIPKKG